MSAMKKWAQVFRKGEGAQALVFVALTMSGMLGMAGLAVDGGNVYVNRTNAQRTADAAALAGARTVLTSSAQGTADAKLYATKNNDPAAVVTVLTITRSHDAVRVKSQKTISLTFLRALGRQTASVNAEGTAQVGPAGSAYGILPWAVNDDSFASYGYNATVTLQPANGNGSGQFNFVSITPPGGQTYANAIVNGVNAQILLNTRYPTNVADGSGLSVTTANALKARINARSTETYATALTGSPRILFVPVIGGGNIPNAPNPVVFTGFRAFFIQSVNQARGTVTGRFVQVDMPKGTIGGASVPDKGVHVVKLIS